MDCTSHHFLLEPTRRSLFPCGDNLVCIIDDREDVWNFAPNLVHVKPYHFFQHTGDINAPPGLAKCENDDKEGFNFTKISDSKEENSVRENGAVKTSGRKCQTHDGEIEQEEGELSEDSRLESGDGTDGCFKKNLSKCGTETDTEIRDKQTKESCSVNKRKTNFVGSLGKDSGNGDSEVTVKQEGDRMASGDMTGDLELTDGEEPTPIKACDRKCSGKAEQKEKPLETPTKPKDGCEVVSDAAGAESRGGGEDDLVEVEDGDDYLLYLEEILKTVHKAFYDLYDELNGEVPDLKSVIPYVRRKLLTGTSLVFSGLVPTHTPLEKSRAYLVARSMGAQVTQDLTPETTHLVAVRPGTAKVNAARRAARNIITVTPDWLWCCAERWEKVDERLFPLSRGGSKNRHPPPHCGSPEHIPTHLQPATRRRTPSGRFMDTINPLMSFSSEDIANMDREVEDIFNESESEGEPDSKVSEQHKVGRSQVQNLESADESSSSSADTLSFENITFKGEHLHDWGILSPVKRKHAAAESDSEEDDDDDMPSTKFRRGEALPSDLEFGDDDSCGSDDPPDEIDDGEWNMMGAALEREFLSGSGD